MEIFTLFGDFVYPIHFFFYREPLDKTYVYEYNSIGNITCVKEYDYYAPEEALPGCYKSVVYEYDPECPDKLKFFDGSRVSYNSMGCPSKYKNKNYEWKNGKLSKIHRGSPTQEVGAYDECIFTYDGYGRRTRKYQISGVNLPPEEAENNHSFEHTTEYSYDNNGRLIRELRTDVIASGTTERTTREFIYLYDESGIIGVMYSYNGSTPQPYYYHRNLQGDVIAIYDANGEKQVEYAYDAWGNCEVIYAGNPEFAKSNPIRYRGYYYDIETKLYYLNARYYSPEWRRFISPDASEYIDPETPNGLNLYAYCYNDPVNYADPSGHFPWLALLIVTGGLVAGGATFGGITAYQSGGDVGVGILEGAFAGLMLSGSVWLMVGGFYVPNGLTSNLGLAMFTYGFNTMAGMVEAGATQIRYSIEHCQSWSSKLTKSLAANAPSIYTTKAISKTFPLFTKFGLKIGEKYSYTIPGEGGAFHSYRSVGEAWSVYKGYYTQKPTAFSYFVAAGVAIWSMCNIYNAIWGTPDYEDWILF